LKVLFIEDDKCKVDEVTSVLRDETIDRALEIEVAASLYSAIAKVNESIYDLIVFDIYLPQDEGEGEIDVSETLIKVFSNSQNYLAESIAITKLDISDIENIDRFNVAGITVVNYADKIGWQGSLSKKLAHIKNAVKYDFLIFTALEKERGAYSKTSMTIGDYKVIKGLNCQEVFLGDERGLIVVPSQMGLVNMAITVSKAVDAFNPKIIAMSGICAGVEGEVNMLDLLVSDICWEYQTGKLKDGEFKQEPYQAKIDHELKISLQQFISSEQMLKDLKRDLYVEELKYSKIRIGPISSGSAVVASQRKMEEIGDQHRKMIGLEMEMYSMYEAASQSLSRPLFFGVKSVVDLGNSKKGDNFHQTACVLSARFVVEFLSTRRPYS